MKLIKRITYAAIFLIFATTTLIAQEKINQFDAQGKRTGIWKKYYKNNRIRYQGQFEAGKEVGVFKFYSAKSSTHPVSVKTFTKGSDIAKVQFYTEEGVIESKGEMIGKNRVGKWVYYHTDGKSVLSEENYVAGVLHGVSNTYYKSGKPTEELQYKNGKLHGNIKRYADNGNLLDDVNYVDGKLHGKAKYYDVSGKLIHSGSYENDEKIGDWEYFGDVKKLKK